MTKYLTDDGDVCVVTGYFTLVSIFSGGHVGLDRINFSIQVKMVTKYPVIRVQSTKKNRCCTRSTDDMITDLLGIRSTVGNQSNGPRLYIDRIQKTVCAWIEA